MYPVGDERWAGSGYQAGAADSEGAAAARTQPYISSTPSRSRASAVTTIQQPRHVSDHLSSSWPVCEKASLLAINPRAKTAQGPNEIKV